MITREDIKKIHDKFIELNEKDDSKKLLEDKYRAIGSKNLEFESYKQIEDFFGYDISEIQGMNNLKDTDKELVKRYILDCINKESIEDRYLNLVYKIEEEVDTFILYTLGRRSDFNKDKLNNTIDTIIYMPKNSKNK